jgi:hypothetical protein
MNVIHNNDSKSPVLQAVIIEPILISCINKVSFYVLALAIQKIMPISIIEIKKYLFYLVDYGLVSYNGLHQVFTIEDGGFGLLDMIDREKRQEKVNLKDITITFECTLYAQKTRN